MLRLALKSVWNRRLTAVLLITSIALSVTLLLGVERLRTQAKDSFTRTLSGTDLVVGARSSPISLMLYAVFGLGDATHNISWAAYRHFSEHPRVAWTIPMSLGDSHRGYRVLATDANYFEHYRYGRQRALTLVEGKTFNGVYEAVLGAEVAERLGYRPGQQIVVAHGAGEVSFAQHKDKPFRVTGILDRTGTVVDRTVHIPLAGMEAIHLDWQGGAPIPWLHLSAERTLRMDLTPKNITAFLVGLKSKAATFRLQREISDYEAEPLLATLPGVALSQLWDLVGVAEGALLLVAGFVVLVGLAGLVTAHVTALEARRREMAILRALGARPGQIFGLMVGEAVLLTLAGATIGLLVLQGLFFLAANWVEGRFGLALVAGWPTLEEWMLAGAVIVCGAIAGLVPAWRAYRFSVADGVTIRL
jgi:putative ABC transport system permease protein